MQKADKGSSLSIPNSLYTCLPLYLYLYPVRPRHSVSLFIVFRGGFASVRPHSRADHSLGQEPVYLYTPTMRTCKRRRFTRAAQFGKCMDGESESANHSVKSHSLWPKAPQGVHPQLKLDQGMKIIMFWEMISLSLTFLTFEIAKQSYQMNV